MPWRPLVPTVLAVDVFDKLNFTGARVPRFEDLRGEFPKDLESSVFFSADFFKPPDRKGEAHGLVEGGPLQVPEGKAQASQRALRLRTCRGRAAAGAGGKQGAGITACSAPAPLPCLRSPGAGRRRSKGRFFTKIWPTHPVMME